MPHKNCSIDISKTKENDEQGKDAFFKDIIDRNLHHYNCLDDVINEDNRIDKYDIVINQDGK